MEGIDLRIDFATERIPCGVAGCRREIRPGDDYLLRPVGDGTLQALCRGCAAGHLADQRALALASIRSRAFGRLGPALRAQETRALADLVRAAREHHGRPCAVCWSYDPDGPEKFAWACWVDAAPDQVWRGDSQLGAAAEALKVLGVNAR